MLAKFPHRCKSPAPHRLGLPLALLALLVSACGGPAKGPEGVSPPGERYTFEGTGAATGHRQTLRLGAERKVTIVDLSGSLLLIGEKRLGQGFRMEMIGYNDSLKGGTGWCVWTDSRDDQVFSEIRGERIGTGARFTGTLLGGTGRWAGMTGEYEFEWQFVIDSEEGDIQGRITGLRGRFRLDAPSASPHRKNARRKAGPAHEPA